MSSVVNKTSKNTSAIFQFPRIYNRTVGKLYFMRTYNNIFLTLTDFTDKVVATISGGQCSPNNNKRLKKAAHMIPNLIMKLKPIFHYYQINAMLLCLKSKGGLYISSIIEELKLIDIFLLKIIDRRKRAHNGVRGKKPRRV
jgi:ribosomal protein S11